MPSTNRVQRVSVSPTRLSSPDARLVLYIRALRDEDKSYNAILKAIFLDRLRWVHREAHLLQFKINILSESTAYRARIEAWHQESARLARRGWLRCQLLSNLSDRGRQSDTGSLKDFAAGALGLVA